MTVGRIGAFLTIVFLAVSCTSASPGESMPATTNGSDDEPNRPHEISLDDVDPCALLPQADYDDFTLDEPGRPDKSDKGADLCVWMGEVGFMEAALITYESVEARQERAMEFESTDSIEGFPAYNITLAEVENSCFTSVDVADGQYLDAHVGLDSVSEDGPSPCEYSHQLATSLMSTLVR